MNFQDAAIGVIGCGNMGSALVEHLRKSCLSKNIFVFDKDKSKEGSLSVGFGAKVSASIAHLVSDSDAFIIAVKPQDIDGVLGDIKVSSEKLVISIAAGVTFSRLESKLGLNTAIVRAMPNLNALIGLSVTALCRNKAVSQIQWSLAERIFRCVGDVVFVQEGQFNSVTAISGSGPAFVAYLIEELGEKDLEEGLKREAIGFGIELETARALAHATVEGTRRILSINFDTDMLIRRVCSKGGTTEAGMCVLLEKGKTLEALSEAVKAAKKRADELARQ